MLGVYGVFDDVILFLSLGSRRFVRFVRVGVNGVGFVTVRIFASVSVMVSVVSSVAVSVLLTVLSFLGVLYDVLCQFVSVSMPVCLCLKKEC